MKVQQRKDFQRLADEKLKSDFFCPSCGEITQKRPTHREGVACQCGASWRAQACMLAILQGLGYPPSIKPKDIQTDFSRLGLGISDDFLLARRISNLFSYTNSFYHRFPILDVMNPPDSATNFFEFVSCFDVLEHTPPPSSSALAGLFRSLKPGGFAAFSVPCSGSSDTNEYYPGLKEWYVTDGVLHWTDELGTEHLDTDSEFHGGSGQTLTFRLWSFDDLIRQCEAVGFSEVVPVTNLPPLAGGAASGKYGGLVIARRP